jgi:hypothetical protein
MQLPSSSKAQVGIVGFRAPVSFVLDTYTKMDDRHKLPSAIHSDVFGFFLVCLRLLIMVALDDTILFRHIFTLWPLSVYDFFFGFI